VALTGDLARADADGYLWYSSRDDDVINSGGYRIGPAEIENCLVGHSAVAMATVVGVPDAVRGEAAKAFVCSPRADTYPRARGGDTRPGQKSARRLPLPAPH
jgi:acyl-coenzyme A synthetase/AMP-(fatty) acid ligase